jgi:hypothetical protein
VPELIHFVACNEVLLDDYNNPSLISVFIALEAKHKKDEEIDPRSMAPRPWTVFTMWLAEDKTDLGKKYTQKLVIETPDGREFGDNTEDFTMVKEAHTIRTKVAGFPVGVEGKVLMKVWIEDAMGTRITKIRKSRINVKHVKERL